MLDKHWQNDWFDLPLAVFDVETTGLDENDDRIIEVGVVHFLRGEQQGVYNWLINPGRAIPEEVVNITGIRQEDVEGQPFFGDLIEDIYSSMVGRVLVAYNLPFDRKMLSAAFQREGYSWFDKQPSLDPLIIARHFYEGQNNTLKNVCERKSISLENAHRACHDAEATGKLLYAFGSDLAKSLEDLLKQVAQWEIEQREKASPWQRKRGMGALSSFLLSSGDEEGLGWSFFQGQEPDPLRAFYERVPDIRK